MVTNSELICELRKMQEEGLKVDDRTLNLASKEDLSGYEGIGVEQLASMFCELYNWT